MEETAKRLSVSTYRAALSVLEGRDHDVLPLLINLHARTNPRILDATYGMGTMWRGTEIVPVSMDIDASKGADYTGDFTKMPFANESFDVVVFDPPHLPSHAASANASKIWERRYGITADGEYRQGDSVSPLFAPFLSEASRVLRPDGIVLAKLADIVHNHRYQWHHVDFIVAARALGLTPCDLLVKRDPSAGSLKSSKWLNANHLRKAHSFWIVVRKGRCERAAKSCKKESQFES